MKNRVISGIGYVAVLLGFYLLKIFVHDFFFDALIYFFALVGTFEMLRAMKEHTTKAERGIVAIFAIVTVPACAITEDYVQFGLHVTCICFFALAVALLSLLVLRHDETTLENLGISLLSAVYPSLLLCLLVLTNHIDPALMRVSSKRLAEICFNSDLLILMIFVVSPISDTMAFLFGKFLGKFFPAKMAPTISPNKTIVGAIGGLIGGAVGAGILYFVYQWLFVGAWIDMQVWLPVYLAIGFFSSLANEFGDLVESCIKRKVGLKDMGKIMPGHGGILDRIDGTLFACGAVYLMYSLIVLLA